MFVALLCGLLKSWVLWVMCAELYTLYEKWVHTENTLQCFNHKIAPRNEHRTLVKYEYKEWICGWICPLITCQVYEDVAPVIREEAFRAWSAGRQPSSQNTQEVLHRHLKSGQDTKNGTDFHNIAWHAYRGLIKRWDHRDCQKAQHNFTRQNFCHKLNFASVGSAHGSCLPDIRLKCQLIILRFHLQSESVYPMEWTIQTQER